MWPHKKLHAYQRALDAAEAIDEYVKRIPPAPADLRNELRRASSSMVLNTAEGADEHAASEKARFSRMARRSAGERSAALDLCSRIFTPKIADAHIQKALSEVASMLTAMIRRHEQ